MKSGNTPPQNLSTKTEVGTSRCDVPARASAGGKDASSHQYAERCAAERGADGAARRPYLALIFLAALFISLAVGCATQKPAPAPDAQANAKPLPFAKDIADFEASDRTNPPPRGAILFIGSSSIRLWKTLAQDFPDHRVINRGFGGSQIADSVRYADRIVLPYQPKQIVLYAGGNDINAKKTPGQVFADYKAFVKTIHAELPQTTITYISVAPNPARWKQVERVKQLNRSISDYTKTDKRLTYIDTFTHMLGSDNKPLPDIYMADRLHMNAKGYALWKGIVGPALLP